MTALRAIEQYDGAQDSGIEWLGHIPAHWQLKRLKFVVDIVKRIAGTEGFDVLSITQKGIKVKDVESGEGQLAMDYSKYQFLYKGEFAMNHMDLLTGYVDISQYDGVVSPDYRVFRNRSSEVLDAYLLLIFQMGYTQRIFYKYGQGVSFLGRWRFPADNFNNFFIPIPPIDEQELIVNFVSRKTKDIDDAIAIKETQIALLQERKKIVINEAVLRGLDQNVPMKESNVECIGQVPKHWKLMALRYAFVFKNNKRLPLSAVERETRQGTFPYYGASGIIDYVDDYIFDEELILIAEDGANLLSKSTPLAFVASGKYWVNNHAHIIKPKYPGFRYWAELLSTLDYTVHITGAAQPKLSRENLGSVIVPVPPVTEIKTIIEHIETVVPDIENAITLQHQQIKKLKEYRATLIHSAVTGKIKVA